jgi:hypothetical protein
VNLKFKRRTKEANVHQLLYKRWGKLIGENTIQVIPGKEQTEIKAFKAGILKFKSNPLDNQ